MRSSMKFSRAGLFLAVVLALQVRATEPVQLLVTNARVLVAPGAQVQRLDYLAINGGRITQLGERGAAPAAQQVLDAGGRLVTAGFWNAHVHFTEPHWEGAARTDSAQLDRWLMRMLTRYGFTTGLDAGSDPVNTEALSYRLERGRVLGPRVLMSGGSFVPVNGNPAYVDVALPELYTAADARQKLAWVLNRDIAAVKIFSGSFLSAVETAVMPLEVVQAVTGEAHQSGVPVLAHPQSMEGVRNAVYGGVDVLAHTAPNGGPWPANLVTDMVDKNVALVPTLQLWQYVFNGAGLPANLTRQLEQVAVGQLSQFTAAGGEVLFGTDVGFMTDYDPRREYQLLKQAGLDYRSILTALTTAPSARFGSRGETGRLEAGQPGDLVVLNGDPREEAAGFADVYATIKGGVVIYSQQGVIE
jgi:imidazolonepropionase-like amidohydrolase